MVKAEKITNRMKELNLNKESICAALGISVSSLNNKLHGRTAFTVQEARDIAEILHFSKEEMLDIFFSKSSQNVNKRKASNG